MMPQGARASVSAHAWQREPHEWYVEENWCSERLFEEEHFDDGSVVWDPCCGMGRVAEAARKAGHRVYATDIVDRGYAGLDAIQDFMLVAWPSTAPNIVCNPPFSIAREFAEHALSLEGVCKVAMVFPTARLNAAGKWLESSPLLRIWHMTPRPSMPPGHVVARGEKPGGGKVDYSWLVWAKGHEGHPETRWLHRDRETQIRARAA